jgi:hypothetical protein
MAWEEGEGWRDLEPVAGTEPWWPYVLGLMVLIGCAAGIWGLTQ